MSNKKFGKQKNFKKNGLAFFFFYGNMYSCKNAKGGDSVSKRQNWNF